MTAFTRRTWLTIAAAGLCGSFARAMSLSANQLAVHLDGDYLRISAPHLNFLSGKSIERLKEGATVAFLGQLTLTTGPNAIEARAVARFALSYDIWEEKFSVTKIGESADSRRSVSHLSASATENWCLDNLAIDRSRLPPDKPFFVQVELRAEDPRDEASVIGDPGINITRLIEIFGRPARGQQPRWSMIGGPFRLSDLKRSEVKGVRG